MKEKQLRQLILGAIAIVIGILLILILNSIRGKQQNSFRDTLSFKFDSVNSVEMISGQSDLLFEQKNGVWSVNTLVADPSRIQAIVNNLFDSKIVAIISQNVNNYPLFNLDDVNAKHLIIKSTTGGNSEIFLGKASVTSGMYARFPNDKNIYEINRDLTNFLATDVNYYRNKGILSLNPDNISKFKINGAEFIKNGNDWTLNSNKLANQKVTDYLKALSNLTALSFASDDIAKSANFNDNDLKIEVTVDSPISIELNNFSDTYYAKKDSTVYLISKDDYGSLNKKYEDFN